MYTSLLTSAPLSGDSPGLHLFKVLLLRHTCLLELLHECILTSPCASSVRASQQAISVSSHMLEILLVRPTDKATDGVVRG
jgi:hypothetical protein